ncbi:hypothetical protein Btru_064032 [Bulinus truncatus]|nr:hypothetical protein Btru_064032 [Bulinus truncatus]
MEVIVSETRSLMSYFTANNESRLQAPPLKSEKVTARSLIGCAVRCKEHTEPWACNAFHWDTTSANCELLMVDPRSVNQTSFMQAKELWHNTNVCKDTKQSGPPLRAKRLLPIGPMAYSSHLSILVRQQDIRGINLGGSFCFSISSPRPIARPLSRDIPSHIRAEMVKQEEINLPALREREAIKGRQ